MIGILNVDFSLRYLNLVQYVTIVLFRLIVVRGQQSDCVSTMQISMTEYRQCVDYAYQLLFNLNYYELNSYNVMQKCSANNFGNCREVAEKKLGGCLDFTQREALETTFQMVDAGFRYWCSDYAIKLLEFYNKRGPDCYFQQQSIFRTCELEYPLINVYLRAYDNNYCRIINSVLNCLQQVYERCLSHEDPSMIRGYYETMWKSTPCFFVDQQYLLSDASSFKIHQHVVLMTLIFVFESLVFFFRT